MEKTKFLYGALGLLALGLSACSSDAPVIENGKVEADATRFLSVQISSPLEGTRAMTFEDGSKNESAVTRLDFLFYDVNGNPTSKPQYFTGAELNGTKDDPNFTEGPFNDQTTGNVTRIWTSVVPVELVQGQNLPAQVVCLVNATPEAVNELSTKSLDDLRDIKRNYFNNAESFLMSNSVYFGTNVLTGQANQRLCATPINANSQLFGTREEAKDAITKGNATNAEAADKAALVNIYVERLAAKVGLTMASTAVKTVSLANGAGGDNVTLTFTPEYWFMNAVSNQNFITKRYGVMNGNDIVMTPTYEQINAAFNTTGNLMKDAWNAPDDHRSYWGCSPSYYTATYPLVSDQVDDLGGTNRTDGYTKGTFDNKYYSYNEVKNQVTTPTSIANQAIAATNGAFSIVNGGDAATGYIYTRETTTTIADIKDIAANPAATVASAVLVGSYKVGDAAAASTFYVDANNNYNYNSTSHTGTQGTYYADEAAARAELTSRQFIVFTDAAGTTPAGTDIFTVKHPDYTVRKELANPNIAGRLVTIQMETVPTPAVYYFDGNDYVPVTAANLADVNAQLVSVGYMNMYNNGRAFFNIPIRHLGFRATSYADGKYEWKDMLLGELGLVRNHVYSITIDNIYGIGTGLRDDDQPIVPAKDEVNQYIAMRLNILAWNVVNAWHVDF